MEKESNVISMKEVKKQTYFEDAFSGEEEEFPEYEERKKEYKERMKEWKKEQVILRKQLRKKDYILTVHQTGDEFMSGYDYENQVVCRRFYAVCSLLEIQDYIERMKQGFWEPTEKGLSKKELDNYPHEKKKWGKFWNIVIEPLSKELEESYIDARSRKFFKSWREIRDEREKEEK